MRWSVLSREVTGLDLHLIRVMLATMIQAVEVGNSGASEDVFILIDQTLPMKTKMVVLVVIRRS